MFVGQTFLELGVFAVNVELIKHTHRLSKYVYVPKVSIWLEIHAADVQVDFPTINRLFLACKFVDKMKSSIKLPQDVIVDHALLE